MNKGLVGAVIGAAILAVSTAASAHVDVAIGLGVPGPVYAPAQPVYVAPPVRTYAPSPVGYMYERGGWGGPDWRERAWRRDEWRRHEWREHEWREHAWRDGRRWGGDY